MATAFQNKCSLCNNYDELAATPASSSDKVNCPVGGEVSVATGCASFAPSAKAACGTCWNFSDDADKGSCSVHGVLQALRTSCPDAVARVSA